MPMLHKSLLLFLNRFSLSLFKNMPGSPIISRPPSSSCCSALYLMTVKSWGHVSVLLLHPQAPSIHNMASCPYLQTVLAGMTNSLYREACRTHQASSHLKSQLRGQNGRPFYLKLRLIPSPLRPLVVLYWQHFCPFTDSGFLRPL